MSLIQSQLCFWLNLMHSLYQTIRVGVFAWNIKVQNITELSLSVWILHLEFLLAHNVLIWQRSSLGLLLKNHEIRGSFVTWSPASSVNGSLKCTSIYLLDLDLLTVDFYKRPFNIVLFFLFFSAGYVPEYFCASALENDLFHYLTTYD